jgi:long-chain acyl-CoA synthetase
MTATLAGLVRDRAHQTPDRVAVRSKRLGIWHEVTWAQFWSDVQRAAQELLQLGVAPGNRVAIVSENRYEWVVIDAATVAVRGATVGLDPLTDPAHVQAALSSTRATVVVAENSEQVDKVLAVADRLPDLVHLCYLDGRGVPTQPDQTGWNDVYDDPRLRPWHGASDQGADGVRERMDAAEPTDVVAVLPPASELISADAARRIEAITRDITPPPSDTDLALPLVSLADGTTRVCSSWLSAATGVQLHMVESVSTLRRDFREVQPTLLFAPAPVWERLAADIEQRMAGASRIKRWAWRTWRPGGSRPAGSLARASSRGDPSVIGRLVVHRPLRGRAGMRHLRHAGYTGTLASEVLSFFAGMGIALSREAPWNA